MAKLRKMLTHRGKNESGQGALAMVLILLMLGAVVLTPLLVFMSTGLKSGQVYESKMQEFYAADAGVEDGLWQIRYDKLSTLFDSYPYNPYNYNTSYSYSLAPSTLDYEINAENVTVNISNVWIPDVDALDPDVARDIIESGTLIVTGKVITLDGETGYQITISYYYQADDPDGTSLNVDEIGVWLGTGFHYVPGGLGNLNGYDSSPDIVPHCGGEAIIWDVGSAFKLPGDTDYPLVRTFDFQFTGGQNPQAVSWITTTGVAAVPLSWDADSKPYRIESTAGSTTAEAYVIKNELRKLGAAIPGDYFATGNSLIGYGSTERYKDLLYKESETTIATDEYGIDGIPSEATVEAAFLYWTGWIDFHYRYCTWWRHGHCMRWREGEIGALEYPSNPTPENLAVLVEENAKVNNVSFSIGDNMTEVTADSWQVLEATVDEELYDTWSYCCFADVTDLVKGAIEAEEIGTNGAATYTLSHSSAVINQHRPETDYYFDFYDSGDATGYPLGTPALEQSGLRYQYSHAGWSLVIIYSSPETRGHQLYLYDIESPGFIFTLAWEPGGIPNPDFDGDGEGGGHISGFLVPEPIEGEDIAAKLTVFVGEGDNFIEGDQLLVNNQVMSNDESPSDNVWNANSPGLNVPGVDIDTFYIEWDDGIINPADTSAQVDLPTQSDGFNLVYIILSFRSDITTGGTISYLLRGG